MALKKTQHVLVPSNNTKRDLVKLFRYPQGKITITPLAAGEEFFELRNYGITELRKVKEKYKLPGEFILTVAGLEPRKNVGMLVDIIMNPGLRENDMALVIVGGKGWKSKSTQRKILEAGPHVMHREHCDPKDLPAIYHLAKVFVYPSLYEGFGLPPLEAMAAGCPVICSNAASLPEVVGDAALTFDPRNENELTTQLEKLLSNESLRRELIEKGKKQAAKFSWRKTAELTMKAFEKIRNKYDLLF